MKNKKTILTVLVLMLAVCLGAAAMAEVPADPAVSTAAKEAADAAQEAAEAARAEDTALNEALEAYGKAKAESRKLDLLSSLKAELDSYVTAGSLTQEQADLILKYYAEQLTLQQNGMDFGRNGRGGRGGRGPGRGAAGIPDADSGMNSQDSGSRGGRHGRFGSTAPAPQQDTEAPAEQNSSDT